VRPKTDHQGAVDAEPPFEWLPRLSGPHYPPMMRGGRVRAWTTTHAMRL